MGSTAMYTRTYSTHSWSVRANQPSNLFEKMSHGTNTQTALASAGAAASRHDS